MANEGQTATNPQTGEKIIFSGGQWGPMGGAPQAPGIIMGRPKQPTGLQLSAEQRAEQDQAMQMRRDQEMREKDAITKERDALKLDSERARMDATGGVDGTEGENKAAALTTNLTSAMNNIRGVTKRSPDAAKPGFGEMVGGMFGDDAKEFMQSSDRRDVAGSQFIAVDSALTLATGAAYTPSQLEGYTRSLFPTLNDSPENIASKRRKFEQIIQAGRLQAGAKAPSIDQAIAAVDAIYGPVGGEPDGNTPKGGAVDSALRAKYPEATKFHYNKGELVGFEDKDGDFITLLDTSNRGGGPDLGDALHAGVGDVAEGVGDVLGLVANPLNAGINAVAGTNFGTDLGQTFRDATGAPQGDPMATAINKGGVAALTGSGLGMAARGAQGAGGYVANALASQPAQQFAGGMAAGGSSEAARQMGAPPAVQAGVGLVGGMLGYGGTNALLNVGKPQTLAPVAQAAQRQGVDLLPAQTGGTATRIATAGGRQGIVSEIPIAKAVVRQSEQLEAVRSRASSNVGNAVDKDDAGDLVRKAADIYSKKTGQTGSSLYTRAFQRAGDTKAKLDTAVKVVDEEMAKIAEAPGGKETALYKELAGLKKNMAGGKFSIEGIRAMRTTLREEADFKGIRGSNSNRIYSRVVNAASDDMTAALTSAGKKDAAAAFKTADAFWKTRVETIDDVLDPVLGKNTARSGEQILSALERMGNRETGDAAKLRQLMTAMPESEARNVRATIIERLGKPTAGQETDNTFSLGKFLTDYNNMSGKAKSIIFTGESRRALDDLAKIAQADKQAGRLLNSSNTARAVGVQAGVSGLAGFFLSPLTAVGIAGGQFAFGKLLASPKFAQWLAKMPANQAAIPAYTKKLSAIAAAEPIIANDIASVKQFLSNAPSSTRAAASEGDEVGKERPVKP